MTKTIHGKVHGKSIELDEKLGRMIFRSCGETPHLRGILEELQGWRHVQRP